MRQEELDHGYESDNKFTKVLGKKQAMLAILDVSRQLRLPWLRRCGAPAVRAVFATLDAEALLDPRWNLVKYQVELAIVDYSKMIKAERDERTTFNARLVVCSLGEIACGDCLGSGRYHSCRGVLTHDGIAIEKLTRHILGVLHELGAYTQEICAKSLKGMSDPITGSG